MSKTLVEVYNEWDPLEEVIIGTAQGAQVPKGDKGLHAIRYSSYENVDSIPTGPHNSRIIEEAEEDLIAFIDVVKKAGVIELSTFVNISYFEVLEENAINLEISTLANNCWNS